jgi:hypothetical protein
LVRSRIIIRAVAGQGVRLPQKLGEVEHGVVAAGAVEGRVDGELLPGAVPDDDVRVAADRYAVVPVEVDDLVARELVEDPAVLVDPEGQQVDDEQLDLPVEAARAGE